MLKKAVKQRQLALMAQTIRNLADLGRVNGGQGMRPEVESGNSATVDACSSKTY
jgi:hypothetical protein